jgi:LacI family transcriptional regulator
MPTLADVAKVAGVGLMSVSRVVNGTRRVTPEIEEKVRDAIRRIGYAPNEAARMLRGQRARVLGLIVPDLADPFFAICADAVQRKAREAGYMTLMISSDFQIAVERQQAEMMMQRQLAGLIIVPISLENSYLRQINSEGLPIVALDRPLEGVKTDEVLVDNRQAAARLVEHLIGHGHRNILCIVYDFRMYTIQERLAGYKQAMRKAKLPVRVCMVGPIAGTAREQLPAILASEPKPTAIFAANDVIAIQTLHELERLKVKVPGTIALASFDDFDAATLVSPKMTVVRQPVAALGGKAVSLLLDRIEANNSQAPRRIILETELIIRASCGCRPKKTN